MRSLQSAVHALSFDPVLARVFAATPWPEVAGVSDWIAQSDPFGETWAIARALRIAASDGGRLQAHIEHQLWCAWRQAAWTCGRADPLPVRLEGREWIAETQGRPTLLVTPMTLSSGDGLAVIRQLIDPGRPCVVFGEGFAAGPSAPTGPEIVGDVSKVAARRIFDVLAAGGVFCTYPDFVYKGHATASIALFGVERPISASFLSLASRHGTMLVPLVCLRTGDGLAVRIEEPVEIQTPAAPDLAAHMGARRAVGSAVGELLEGLISYAPEQWLLLPTLTFEAPQMAASPVG